MNFMISKVATSCAVFASVVFGVALTADEAKALLDKTEAGFKENYKLLTELAALPVL